MNTLRIGIIGAGGVGTTLGQGWARAGHQVRYGVRDPGAARPPGGAAVSVAEAAQGDVVVLATPFGAAREALAAAGDLSGKVLIDATNPIGPGFSLALGHSTSGAEELARLQPGARVVKAFNTTGLENMAEPRYPGGRAAMLIAGDDAAARELVLGLARDLGFEALSVGGLVRARQLEPFAMLWIKLALAWGQGRGVAFGLIRRSGAAEPFTGAAATRRRILVVGTGHIGGGLAAGWLRAGHEVRVAARDSASDEAKALAAAGAALVPVAGAAEGADVVALAVPFGAAAAVLGELGDLRGKIVIDSTNPIGPGFTLLHGGDSSGVEELARRAPGARFVKAFNQQGAELLTAPRFDGAPATNFVAADDDEARRAVVALSQDLGLEGVEAGALSSARLLEPVTVLWIAASQALGSRAFGLKLLRR